MIYLTDIITITPDRHTEYMPSPRSIDTPLMEMYLIDILKGTSEIIPNFTSTNQNDLKPRRFCSDKICGFFTDKRLEDRLMAKFLQLYFVEGYFDNISDKQILHFQLPKCQNRPEHVRPGDTVIYCLEKVYWQNYQPLPGQKDPFLTNRNARSDNSDFFFSSNGCQYVCK